MEIVVHVNIGHHGTGQESQMHERQGVDNHVSDEVAVEDVPLLCF